MTIKYVSIPPAPTAPRQLPWCAVCKQLLYFRPDCPDPGCRNHQANATSLRPTASAYPETAGRSPPHGDDLPLLPRRRPRGHHERSRLTDWSAMAINYRPPSERKEAEKQLRFCQQCAGSWAMLAPSLIHLITRLPRMKPHPAPPAYPKNSRIPSALSPWIAALAEHAVRTHLTQNPEENQTVGRSRTNRVRLQVQKKNA